jgi:hypothetical protein
MVLAKRLFGTEIRLRIDTVHHQSANIQPNDRDAWLDEQREILEREKRNPE